MFLVPVTRSHTGLARSFDRLFDDTFDRFFAAAPAADSALRTPALDVSETDAAYAVSLELPGVSKDQVKITIEGRRVTVRADIKRDDDTRKENERVLYRERSWAQYERSFTLPEEVDQENSQAKLDNGVLSLTLAKKRVSGAKQLTIN